VQVLHGLAQHENAELLVGSATSDDAAVYALNAETALVQTLDFFTPVVDDPWLYGQIAAANALSDIYAMGARPITALNIVGMPVDKMGLDVINTILRGGADKVKEAQCSLAGGHTIDTPEPIYGLSVTGLVHPDRRITNTDAHPGDLLVLTKALGTGILSTAIKRGIAEDDVERISAESMAMLNTPGYPLAERGLIRAGTDVTGFGLLGHLGNICRESGVGAHLDHTALPLLHPTTILLADAGCVPGGSRANLALASSWTHFSNAVPPGFRTLAADAQTSGGLLLCVPPDRLDEVLAVLAEAATPCAAIIGKIVPQEEYSLVTVD